MIYEMILIPVAMIASFALGIVCSGNKYLQGWIDGQKQGYDEGNTDGYRRCMDDLHNGRIKVQPDGRVK